MTITGKSPPSTGDGFLIAFIDSFRSSNPINKTRKEMINPEMYSRRPCPKGCSVSGFLAESLNPNN